MRKLLLSLLIAIMLFTLVLPFASAETSTVENGWKNILMLGGDARSTERYDRTDSMIILSINAETFEVKLTSIMRDTWVSMPGRSSKAKINAANVYGGPELAMATVNNCFGTDIADYIIVNMNDLVHIIDLFGGVDIDVTESERKQINTAASEYLRKIAGYDGATQLDTAGSVHLNGLLAMSYTRNRHSDSDYQRVMRQQKVLIALLAQAQNTDVDELMALSDQIFENLATTLDEDALKDLAEIILSVDPVDVSQNRIPVDGTFQAGMYGGTWCIRPDFEENAALLHEFIYGE